MVPSGSSLFQYLLMVQKRLFFIRPHGRGCLISALAMFVGSSGGDSKSDDGLGGC